MVKHKPKNRHAQDPRASKDDITADDIIVLKPGESAPPVMVMLPNGEMIDQNDIDAMSDEEYDAWYANMTASEPTEIDQ